MQRHIKLLFAAIILLFTWSTYAAAGIWRDVTPAQPGARAVPKVRLFEADDPLLRTALADAPHETSGRRDHHLQIPMPDGSLQLFSVQDSPVMAPGLAARYPDIKTFRISGVDNPGMSGRIDITPLGFHGMIQTPAGRVFIDPDDASSQDHVYRSRFAASEPRRVYQCGVTGHSSVDPLVPAGARPKIAARVPGNLLQYRLAVAVTNEYYMNPGSGDDTLTTAVIATTISRVNFIYERDLGIRLNLVANNDLLYETVDSGLLSNNNEQVLLGQVNGWIDTRLPGGDTAYDIGHIFSRPSFLGGGVAFIGSVCDDGFKGGGVSGLPTPTGDAFDVDLVAHEIGHQFNAGHSFNGTEGACLSDNRVAATAYEPGSGSSVMSYAGICDEEDLQSNSDAAFHAGSIAQIEAFTSGLTCQFVDPSPPAPAAGNIDPVITAQTDRTIPANTPFLLEAMATDTDSLEYRWDQMDTGCPTDKDSFGTDNGSNPLFRSRAPRSDSWRNFPALGTQVQGLHDKAEVLACHSRALDFRLTVTDGRSGQDFDDVRVTVDNAAGPFEITNLDPAPAITAGTFFDVIWDPAGTDLAPINCANVDIDLLTFGPGYTTYSEYRLDTTANNGSASVRVMPVNANHPRARIRVKCSDNIFYDISDQDLAVTPVPPADPPLGDNAMTTRFFVDPSLLQVAAPACGAIVDCTPPPAEGIGGKGGSSAFAWQWLLLLACLAGLGRARRHQG